LKQTLADKITLIRENFRAGRVELMEVSGSFRVTFETGQSVYIYLETYDNSITARFETNETDSERRQQEVDTLHRLLVREISFADISEFKEIQSVKNRFVYTAGIRIDESILFHETIVLGSDAAGETEIGLSETKADAAGNKTPAVSDDLSDLARAEKAVEQLETIDAKMIRQSLDMMNLKRSSNVRIGLTRIFRNAVDAEELMHAIQDEAVKLNSDKDHNDLQIIKAINMDGFLEPVIGLLYDAVFDRNSAG